MHSSLLQKFSYSSCSQSQMHILAAIGSEVRGIFNYILKYIFISFLLDLLLSSSLSFYVTQSGRRCRYGQGRVTNPGGWMTPSPLDRKTKANEAEPRWRDRLVLTRVSPITKFQFLTSLCLLRQSPMLVTQATPNGFLSETHQGEVLWASLQLFYHSGIQNGATGGDAEATRVGLVRYDIKRPHAGNQTCVGSLFR